LGTDKPVATRRTLQGGTEESQLSLFARSLTEKSLFTNLPHPDYWLLKENSDHSFVHPLIHLMVYPSLASHELSVGWIHFPSRFTAIIPNVEIHLAP
jgi:hypothetical protein